MKKAKLLAAKLLLMLPLSQSFAQAAPAPAANGNAPGADFAAAAARQKPEWLDPAGVPNDNARTLLRYLRDSGSHGLNPAMYGTDAIAARMDAPVAPAARGAFERTLTKAFVDYMRDMSGPRVNPARAGAAAAYYRAPLTEKQILARYAASGGMEDTLHGIEPKNPLYAALRRELARLDADPAAPPAKGAEKMSHAAQRMQVIDTLERLRWDKDRPARYIEADIASQNVRAVENGLTVQSTNLIVGKVRHPTNEIATVITGAIFHPEWNIPARIIREEKIPKQIADPHFLEKMNIRVFLDGKRIDPARVDWRANLGNPHITMQQQPGPLNALGYLRVEMDNPYSQYLHYTSQPELFREAQRNFSSGCMRMEEPDKMAGFILGMPQAEIDRRKADPARTEVKAPQNLAFFSVYHTVSLGPGGALEYHPDAYRRNERLSRALKETHGLPPAPPARAPAAPRP